MATGKVTKRAVDALKPAERDSFLWDEDLRGFGVKVTPKGARSYVYQFRLGGREAKTRRYTIGAHGSPWTPTTAREEAERLARLVSQGVDPGEADKLRRRVAVDYAFAAYAKRFHEDCKGTGWRALVERSLRLYVVPVLTDKPLPAITRADISSVLDRIPADKPALRRNVFAVVRRLFRWAVSRGDVDRSPCEGMETPPAVTPRDRVLDDAELVAVLRAARAVSKPFGSIVLGLIFTGQRREEVAGLDWSELNRADAVWRLPKERAKNGIASVIPLNAPMVALLDFAAGGGAWPHRGIVFPTSGGRAFNGFAKGKRQLDKRLSSVTEWRLHDLRRTLATGLQRLGVRFEVVESILNHVGASKAGVAGVYQRHDWRDEKRAALDAWAAHLERLEGGADASNVIALAARRA